MARGFWAGCALLELSQGVHVKDKEFACMIVAAESQRSGGHPASGERSKAGKLGRSFQGSELYARSKEEAQTWSLEGFKRRQIWGKGIGLGVRR